MSSGNSKPLNGPAKVGQATFIGVAWGGVALGILFFIFRVAVRLKVFGRLHVDDGLVLFAWVVLLINSILWQVGKDALYENLAVSSGQLYPPPANFEQQTEQYLHRSVAVIVFFYTGLWSIKLSFLLFFKRLGHNVRNQDIVWWVVLTITVASYFSCLGTIEYRCLASSFLYIETHCSQEPGPIRFQRETLRANMILDVLTDALIICVPVNLLWKVRLSIRKKFALSGIFSITVIIMVFAIIRVVVVSSYSQEPDETWLYMWSSIEQTVSIIVACLASFPSLFKKSERASHKRIHEGNGQSYSVSNMRKALFSGGKKSKASQEESDDISMENVGRQHHATMEGEDTGFSAPWHEHSKSSTDTTEPIISVDKAHIRHE